MRGAVVSWVSDRPVDLDNLRKIAHELKAMSTYERRILIECDDLPSGYKVEYCENRGYDSPDKWYEATGPDGKKIGEYHKLEQAVAAVLALRINIPTRLERIK